MNNIEIAYQNFCERRFPLASEPVIAALELRMGRRFPDDYRRFLQKFNGGYFTEPQIVPTLDEECPVDRLTYMCGIGASHITAELGRPHDLSLFDDNDPPQIVKIGYTIMGNLILLVVDPDGDDCGDILLRTIHSESFLLAFSMDEFFSLLRTPVDE